MPQCINACKFPRFTDVRASLFRADHPIMPRPATTRKNEFRSEPRFGNFECPFFFLLACSYVPPTSRLSAEMADMSVAEDDVSMTSPLTTIGTGPATTTTTTTATTTEVSVKEGTIGLSEEEETQQRKEAVQQSASLSLSFPLPCSNSPYSFLASQSNSTLPIPTCLTTNSCGRFIPKIL